MLVAVGAAEVRVTVETAAMTAVEERRSARLVGSRERILSEAASDSSLKFVVIVSRKRQWVKRTMG